MTSPSDSPTPAASHPSRTGNKANWIVIVGIIAIVVVATLWPMVQAWNAVHDFEQTALDAGFTMQQGVSIIVEEPITTPTYLRGVESVSVHRGADAELAIASSMATLDGTYTSTVAFLGKELVILPTAVIEGDLQIAAAKSVTIRGTVNGEVLGNVRRIFRPKPLENTDSADGAP
jgi:hypothetical protein